jgi:hypothetical protein
MAIQFDCPYCTATMRVPDAVMGTIGRCPKCETSLRVPVVEIPDVRAASMTASGAASPTIEAQSPSWADETRELPRIPAAAAKAAHPFADDRDEPRPPASSAGTSLFGNDEPEGRTAAPIDNATAMRMRRDRPRVRGWMWVSLAFVVAAIGIGAAFWWQQKSNPVYTARGEVLAETSLSSVIPQKEIDIPEADWAAIKKALEQSPADLRSPQMNITFESAPRGIKVGLKPGRNRELVAVPIRDVPELVEASSSTNQAMREPRRKALAESLGEMSAQIQSATRAGKPADLSNFGVSVGVTGLGGPLGFACHAVIDRNAYACVFEDREGRLYFLVPTGATDFVIRPREAGNAAQVLPPRLQVHVTVSRGDVETKSNQKPDGDEKLKSDKEPTTDQTASEPEGDSEPASTDQ